MSPRLRKGDYFGELALLTAEVNDVIILDIILFKSVYIYIYIKYILQ